MGFLSSLTGKNTGKATMTAAGENKAELQALRATGSALINQGEADSLGAFNQAIGAYQPWVDSGNNARGMYDNALGLNGADGNAAATGAFQAGPGFQFALDQGTQAALRGASAAGMLNSGNTLTALQDRGNGLANQEYGSWLDRLAGNSSQGLQATGGQAQGYGNIANLYQNTTDDRLSLNSAVTQGLQSANNQWASGMEANNTARGSFLGKLLNGGVSALTGGKVGGLF